eukprot:g14167.t1
MLRREEVNGQVLHLRRLQGKVTYGCGGMLGVKEAWTSVSWRERSLQNADKEGEGNTCLMVASCWRWWKWRLMIFWMWMVTG